MNDQTSAAALSIQLAEFRDALGLPRSTVHAEAFARASNIRMGLEVIRAMYSQAVAETPVDVDPIELGRAVAAYMREHKPVVIGTEPAAKRPPTEDERARAALASILDDVLHGSANGAHQSAEALRLWLDLTERMDAREARRAVCCAPTEPAAEVVARELFDEAETDVGRPSEAGRTSSWHDLAVRIGCRVLGIRFGGLDFFLGDDGRVTQRNSVRFDHEIRPSKATPLAEREPADPRIGKVCSWADDGGWLLTETSTGWSSWHRVRDDARQAAWVREITNHPREVMLAEMAKVPDGYTLEPCAVRPGSEGG